MTLTLPSLTPATVLLLLALICFVIAAVGVPMRRFNVLALGLAFLAARYLVS